MTGIRNFKCLGACVTMSSLPLLGADVSLLGGAKLTGELVAMDKDGIITLVTPISEDPLRIDGTHLMQVDFGVSEDRDGVPSQRVELINGDVLPVRVVSSDDTHLRVSSPDLGELRIPREMVSSIQLGVVPEDVIYSGPESLAGWTGDTHGARNWTYDEGRFHATGQGALSRNDVLPEKFILRFDLIWTTNPNFRLYFADPLSESRERVDRYFMQFAGGGVEIYREAKDKNQPIPIVVLSRSPNQFPGNRLEIELRVDRTSGQIQLYLGGQLEGRYNDPIPGIPKGAGLVLTSQSSRESGLSVGGITTSRWDDEGDRHRTEDRGDGKHDSLIGRYGERFGGRLAEVRDDGEGQVYYFKSDFQEEPLQLPEEEVSMVFLAGKSGKRDAKNTRGLILRLRGNGEMRVSSCVFAETTITVEHPLLGSLELDRAGLTRLEQREISKAEVVKSR